MRTADKNTGESYSGNIMVKADNVKKSFGKNEVLRGISMDIKRGEVAAIIGPSGSGKSTFLRCLIGLERVSGGSIYIEGRPFVENGVRVSEKAARQICSGMGMVFQHFNLFPHMTVRKNLCLASELRGVKKNEAYERAEHLLDKVGLSDKIDEMPSSLSGGQKQRIAIARALMLDPDILLFDEPTSALDPELTGEVLEVMRDLAKDNMTMAIVTHEMGFARDIAHKVVFMDDGIIAQSGTPDELFTNPSSERLVSFLGSFYNR